MGSNINNRPSSGTTFTKGSINATLAANLPLLPVKGDAYDVSVAGSFENSALIIPVNAYFDPPDQIRWNGDNWVKMESGNNVSDAAFDASWDGNVNNAPSKNAVYDEVIKKVNILDASTAGFGFVIDEDTLVSNLDTKVPTQQSVKAYADGKVNDTAFAAGWDSDTTIAPSKNAVYDEMVLKMDKASNLSDVASVATSQTNLNVFSKVESNIRLEERNWYKYTIPVSSNDGLTDYLWFEHFKVTANEPFSVMVKRDGEGYQISDFGVASPSVLADKEIQDLLYDAVIDVTDPNGCGDAITATTSIVRHREILSQDQLGTDTVHIYFNDGDTPTAKRWSLSSTFDIYVSTDNGVVVEANYADSEDVTFMENFFAVNPSSTLQVIYPSLPIRDGSFGAGWNGDTFKAPSRNAVYDEMILKMAKASNLSDLASTSTARTNLDVYSKTEVDVVSDISGLVVGGKGGNGVDNLSGQDLARTQFTAVTVSSGSDDVANLFDGNILSSWTPSNTTDWVRVQLNAAYVVNKYSINAGTSPSTAPKNFTFEGSTDGTTFDVLDTVVDQTGWSAITARTFTFINFKPYTYYRLNISSNVASSSSYTIGNLSINEAQANEIAVANDYIISDTAFAGSWDGVTTIAPSKNAVYDEMITKETVTGAKAQAIKYAIALG